jgi:exodeoxyribonuclease VII large subunit
LARRIFAATTPIISAVGHETDFTICDFVADLRAPTPSAAAEIAVPDKRDLTLRIDSFNERLANALIRRVERARERLDRLALSTDKSRILSSIDNKRQIIKHLEEKSRFMLSSALDRAREALVQNAAKVNALSPLSTISRGYSVAEKDGKVVKSIYELNVDDSISLRVADGYAEVKVTEIRKEKDSCD